MAEKLLRGLKTVWVFSVFMAYPQTTQRPSWLAFKSSPSIRPAASASLITNLKFIRLEIPNLMFQFCPFASPPRGAPPLIGGLTGKIGFRASCGPWFGSVCEFPFGPPLIGGPLKNHYFCFNRILNQPHIPWIRSVLFGTICTKSLIGVAFIWTKLIRFFGRRWRNRLFYVISSWGK
jgi:hypothetical protein